MFQAQKIMIHFEMNVKKEKKITQRAEETENECNFFEIKKMRPTPTKHELILKRSLLVC
jgi:hypothetical protein